MFSLAVKDGKLHAKPHIPMLREDNVRRGFFEADQFEAVRARLPEPLPVVTFAYLTGWRLMSEILPLEWRQMDWAGRVVRLDPGTTKNREGRTFPFTAALETLLKDRLAEHERLKKAGRIIPLVFHRDGERIRSLRKAWDTACGSAGCPGRIPHDFRRTAVRNLERPACRAPQRWQWSATRPNRFTVDTPSSMLECCAKLLRRSTRLRAHFRAH
jgi:integrase